VATGSTSRAKRADSYRSRPHRGVGRHSLEHHREIGGGDRQLVGASRASRASRPSRASRVSRPSRPSRPSRVSRPNRASRPGRPARRPGPTAPGNDRQDLATGPVRQYHVPIGTEAPDVSPRDQRRDPPPPRSARKQRDAVVGHTDPRGLADPPRIFPRPPTDPMTDGERLNRYGGDREGWWSSVSRFRAHDMGAAQPTDSAVGVSGVAAAISRAGTGGSAVGREPAGRRGRLQRQRGGIGHTPRGYRRQLPFLESQSRRQRAFLESQSRRQRARPLRFRRTHGVQDYPRDERAGPPCSDRAGAARRPDRPGARRCGADSVGHASPPAPRP